LNIDPAITNIVKIAVLQFENVKVKSKSTPLWGEIESLSLELRNTYHSMEDAREDITPARQLYKQIGLDPTKQRPSSEALLRRIIKGRELYQVNSVVDTCNLCSLKFLLPIGLYDFAKIKKPVILRLGKENEGYEGIGKGWVNLSGKLAFVDQLGPFGNPSSDSARTKITLETTEVLFVIFTPHDYDDSQLNSHADYAATQMHIFNGGKRTEIFFCG